MLAPASVALLSLLLTTPTSALIFPIRVHYPDGRSRFEVNSSDPFTFQNVYNATAAGADIYVGNLTVGGQTYEVQLDTGSSDLWLDTTGIDTSSLTTTGQSGSLTYGDMTVAEGPILIGNLTFGDFTVPQAFISAPGTNATTSNDTGLLGVGPGSLSVIEATLAGSTFSGNTLLENIFASNETLGRFITMQLSRAFSTGHSSGGIFTIGETVSQFSSIAQSPNLAVVSDSRWIVAMDGVIVNGNNVSGQTAFPSNVTEPTQTLANLDSGTGFGHIPQFYLDAIYKDIPGSEAAGNVYGVPCDSNIALSFVFGGVEYPVHPIDTITAVIDDNGNIFCASGFSSAEAGADEDLLLGDTFLRNVYASYNYGSFVSNETTPPFIQLLSTTDAQKASSEFTSLSQQRNDSLKAAFGGSSGSGGAGNTTAQSAAVPARAGWEPVVAAFSVAVPLLALL